MENIVVVFKAPGFTSKDYDKVWDDLKAAGQSTPKGLLSHVGFAHPDGDWMVVDVWESAEAFGDFGKTLLPILQGTGVNVPQPTVVPAHYFYQAQTESAMA
ncbi:MAG TPA: hypothetical protein VKR32_17745 [Puia sp.]|nr:hypothetical protein [Puia sp.]